MEYNCETLTKVEINKSHSCLMDRRKQKITPQQYLLDYFNFQSLPVKCVLADSCLVSAPDSSVNNFYAHTQKIIIKNQLNNDCLENQQPTKFFLPKNAQLINENFKIRIAEELKDRANYYSNSHELAKNEIIRVYNKLSAIEYESIDMEVSPNASVLFEIKLNLKTLLIVNKPIDKLNDDSVVLTVIQNDEHLFTNLKSLADVVNGAKTLTSA